MKIMVTGATGLIGSALLPYLTNKGHQPVRLVRSQPPAGSADVYFNPQAHAIDPALWNGADAVIHLAGETVAQRWTATSKKRISDSRVEVTRRLCDFLTQCPHPPRVLLSASAIGYYGNRADELLSEDSAPGAGFLAEICQAWEAATQPAMAAGIRVVHLRFGVVLSAQGGALAKMLPPFRLGLGGKIGSGRQYMSWISMDDAVGAIHHALLTPELQGAVNLVAPHPIKNRDFTHTLGQVLGRPAVFAVPATAIRLALGQMGEEALLSSTRVEPRRLEASGYKFLYPELTGVLRHLLDK